MASENQALLFLPRLGILTEQGAAPQLACLLGSSFFIRYFVHCLSRTEEAKSMQQSATRTFLCTAAPLRVLCP